jgi:hypothetical protein
MPGIGCKGERTKKHEASKRQWRKLFAMEARGELKKGEALHHARMSKKEGRPYSSLPERAYQKVRKYGRKKKGRK